MKPSLQISIPEPCTQPWDKMTPVDGGRQCAHCHTDVIDFTTWTDAAIYRFFEDHKEAHVCGMFCTTQLNRNIHIPHQPHSMLYRMAIALGLTIMFANYPEGKGYAQPPFVKSTYSALPDTAVALMNGTLTLSGMVTDTLGEPMVNASIRLSRGDSVISGTVSDFEGYYHIKNLEPGEYRLEVFYTSFVSVGKTINIIHDESANVNFVLKHDGSAPKEIIPIILVNHTK